MRGKMVLSGLILFIAGVVLGLYASERNCLIAFITNGYMSFWILSHYLVLLLHK